MHKIILCISLIINLLNTSTNEVTKVEKIEYNNNSNDLIELEIILLASKKDLIEMQICFYDAINNKLQDTCYSSAIEVEGRKKTIASIAKDIKEDMYLNMTFLSINTDKQIDKVTLPIYLHEQENCYLSKQYYCKSKKPSKVIYQGKKINEFYDEISLVSKDHNYYSNNNLMPIERIKIISKNEALVGFANLYIYQEISEFHAYYDNKYTFPLKISLDYGISFTFENNYYLDLLKGIMYENYTFDTIKMRQIIFPYKDEEYDIKIEISNCFNIIKNIEVDFKVSTKGRLFGNCNENKYCLRRIYK